jgi:hypothetical protein
VRRRIVPLILAMGAMALLVAGCSFHAEAGPSASAASIARNAEKAIAKKVHVTPAIDCGKKDVIIVEGKSITCDLTDPTTQDVFDVTITFTDVKGAKYHLDAQVAQTPKKKGPGDDAGDPSGSGSGTTVPGTQLAQLAASALAPKIGAQKVSCADASVPLKVGTVEKCSFTADGAEHEVEVTITDVDGAHFDINAKVVS